MIKRKPLFSKFKKKVPELYPNNSFANFEKGSILSFFARFFGFIAYFGLRKSPKLTQHAPRNTFFRRFCKVKTKNTKKAKLKYPI